MQGDPLPDPSRRAAASGRDAWKAASHAALAPGLCVLVALAARIWLWVPVTTPDSERFTLQARELAAGAGLLWAGQPTTSLPPGYPLFLAVLRWLGLPEAAYSPVGVILGALACGAGFLATRTAGPRLAWAVGLGLALHPWLARQCAYVLSEALAMFLAALVALAASRLATSPDPRPWAAPAGALLAALVLTAPGTLVVGGLGGLALLLGLRRSRGAAAALVLAAAVLVAPWQLYCLRHAGRLVPTVVTPTGAMVSGTGRWVRTWLIWPEELVVLWQPRRLGEAPARAFDPSSERDRLVELAEDVAPGAAQRLDAELGVLARRREAEHLRMAGLTLLRASVLWAAMPRLDHLDLDWVLRAGPSAFVRDRGEVGPVRAGLRQVKALASAGMAGVYLVVALCSLVVAWRAARGGHPWAIAVLVGTLAYLLASGHLALVEPRRNAPFYFLLLPLAAVGARTGAAGKD